MSGGRGKGAKRGKGGGGGEVKQLSEQMADLSTNPKEKLPLYPLKPQRTGPAPGTVVRLITNLFRLSIKQNKPIFAFSATVDKEDLPKEGGDDKKTTSLPPRKIASHIRRELLDRAVRMWISKDKHKAFDKSLEFNYIIDRNGTALYALFDLFEKSSDTKKEFRVTFKEERTFEKGLVEQEDVYRVCIFKGDRLDFQGLQNFCNGKGENDITLFQEHIRALNLIMRGKLHTIPINIITTTSIIPFKKENQFKLSEGVIGNRGYFMSVRPAECGIVLNVANAHAVFHEENALTDLLRSRFSVRDLSQRLNNEIIAKLKKEIYNKQVQAIHINYGTKAKPHYRKYRVNDISGSANDKFTLVDKVSKTSKEITIADYFFKEYKVKLKYPNLPCIVDKGRKVPLEVCSLIEKQTVSRMLLPDETANMIRFAALKPDQGFRQINESVQEIKRLDKPAQEFGIDFNPTPIEVNGREIKPTPLVGRAGRDIFPNNGEYRPQNESFLKPVTVNKWALIFIVDVEAQRMRESHQEQAQFGMLLEKKFIRSYVNEARKRGMQIAENTVNTEFMPFTNDPDLRTKLKDLFKRMNSAKCDHGIIFLPSRVPDWVYGYIQYLEVCKQSSRKSTEKYTRTSCVKLENYWRKIVTDRFGGTMFISNLLLKYNTKLGGVNFALKNDGSRKYLQDGYIFISVDVCHPAPGDKLIQSVAAVVGMWDLTVPQMSYCTKIRVQKKQRADHSTIEEVGEIDKMFEDVLLTYRQKKKVFPNKIMVLRDGVSEGQLKIVLETELSKVKMMIRRIYGAYKANIPLMSCLVVQKRHKVCFKRVQPFQTPKGPDYNIQPGTVVDSTITHPKDFCFYLAPHRAIQGTSRPAHIYMILDEIKFTQDEAQAMVHALSYLSPRCTKGTSIPTPVNLADLAAERGKNIVISWNEENNRLKLTEDERFAKLNEFLSSLADDEYKNTLFYV